MEQFQETRPAQNSMAINDDNGLADDHASSGDDDSSESNGEDNYNADDIVMEVRDLYNRSKIDILSELVKSRTQQAILQNHVELLQNAMKKSISIRTKLQLELVGNSKMLLSLQEMANQQTSTAAVAVKRYNEVVDMIGELDLKRIELGKENRSLMARFNECRERVEEMKRKYEEQMSNARLEAEQLAELKTRFHDLTASCDTMKSQLVEAEKKQSSLISSHSEKLNEMASQIEDLKKKLVDSEASVANEVQKNNILKERTDMFLTEKTKLGTQVEILEQKLTQLEQDKEKQLAEAEAAWHNQYEEATRNVFAECEQLKATLNGKNGEMIQLNETIEKLRSDLDKHRSEYEQQKVKSDAMESEVDGMKAILDERNQEICALHAKLSTEQKKLEEIKRQMQEKVEEVNCHLQEYQKEKNEKQSTISRLESINRDYTVRINSLENQLKEKNEVVRVLDGKSTEIEKSKTRIAQLEQALADQVDKVNQLEQHLRANQVANRENIDSLNEQATAQLTSTPVRTVELDESFECSSPKRACVIESKNGSPVPSVTSNYSTFQHNVQQKAIRFFKRKSPKSQMPKPLTTKNLLSGSRRGSIHEELNISLGSTVNIDDEPTDSGNTSSGSSIRFVKPFFRKE